MKIKLLLIVFFIWFSCFPSVTGQANTGWKLRLSANRRFLEKEDGTPFFWLGDTGWLLFNKLSREEAVKYLENRRQKDFNVIQVMVLHTLNEVNYYGDSALVSSDLSRPLTTRGNSMNDPEQYDFWDHVDFIVDKAAEKGIYLAMVPVWGSNVKAGKVTVNEAKAYAEFLAERYKNKPNIIWLNGGDIRGSDSTAIWNTIGTTLYKKDPNHLISFHPRGRTSSSEWFNNEPWLTFNMFQSGHRRYDQDTSSNDKLHFGEDNWRYVVADYKLQPVKPVLDGEPSYEGIPQGLHDTLQPVWAESDVRRYAYWSVFTGAFGFTYGNNAVMQMHSPKDKAAAYGAHQFWMDAVNDPGAGQMKYLKNLMLSKQYMSGVYCPSLIVNQGEKYNYLAATCGQNYAMIYTYNGRNIELNMGMIKGKKVKASWYDPRTGIYTSIGELNNNGKATFNPPGQEKNGNDWVLVLDSF